MITLGVCVREGYKKKEREQQNFIYSVYTPCFSGTKHMHIHTKGTQRREENMTEQCTEILISSNFNIVLSCSSSTSTCTIETANRHSIASVYKTENTAPVADDSSESSTKTLITDQYYPYYTKSAK